MSMSSLVSPGGRQTLHPHTAVKVVAVDFQLTGRVAAVPSVHQASQWSKWTVEVELTTVPSDAVRVQYPDQLSEGGFEDVISTT